MTAKICAYRSTVRPNPESTVAGGLPRVKMAYGHGTRAGDTEELIDIVDSILYRIMENMVQAGG